MPRGGTSGQNKGHISKRKLFLLWNPLYLIDIYYVGLASVPCLKLVKRFECQYVHFCAFPKIVIKSPPTDICSQPHKLYPLCI